MSFHLVPHLPWLVAIFYLSRKTKQFHFYYVFIYIYFIIIFIYFIIIFFINNQGKQHKMLNINQLQRDGCKVSLLLISLCVKEK